MGMLIWRLETDVSYPAEQTQTMFTRMKTRGIQALASPRPKLVCVEGRLRAGGDPKSYARSVPPHVSGSTSSSVWENVQRCPAGSAAAYCRSPYSKSVGSIRIRAPCARARAQWGVRIVHAHEHRMRGLALPGRALVVAHVGDDHGAVTDGELRAVALADPQTLDEPERGAEPRDGLPDVRIDEDRDYDRRRDRPVRLHGSPHPRWGDYSSGGSCSSQDPPDTGRLAPEA